jgi:hypothetical protein
MCQYTEDCDAGDESVGRKEQGYGQATITVVWCEACGYSDAL